MAIIDRKDFDFLLNWLGLEDLLKHPRFEAHSADSVAAMLTLVQELTEREIAPHLRKSDLEEPRLSEGGKVTVIPEVAKGVRQIAEAGLFNTVFDEELGGLQLPHLVYIASMGMLMSGGAATPSFMLLTVANARLICTFGTPAQIDSFAKPQILGETLGTMCLSEPHAGSSLADIRTRAVEEGADDHGRRFRLFGSKMWTSAADHDVTENIVHLVLAKIPNADKQLPSGTEGISLFIVPKFLPNGERNDVFVSGLNHKMGYRGIPNCAVNFGGGEATPQSAAGAIGWLVGEPGQGLPQMFQMMNEARVSVGLNGAALASRGYLMALDYARDRKQGRRPGVRDGEPVAIIEHADVRRMLLAQRAIAQGAMALVLYSARLLDEEKYGATPEKREEAAALLALLTPVTKSFPAEFAQEALHLALQIHGGAGYTRDFEIEQLYRDNRLNPIHEGTTGIQGMDLVGRKIRKEKGRTLKRLHGRVTAALARASDFKDLKFSAARLGDAWSEIMDAADILIAERDDRIATANATSFLFSFGHAVVGWIWLEQALEADTQLSGAAPDPAFLRGKIHTFRFFAETELPRVAAWLEPVKSGCELALTIGDDEF
jgi:alkylation response protein AidB-like acyl-CoA dehydrogenase